MSLRNTWDPPRPGWTCSECGFDYDGTVVASAAEAVRSFGRRYTAPLTRGLRDEDLDTVLRLRPSADTWSALEYACHVRDVMSLYDSRIGQALSDDRPEVQAMGRDAMAVERNYNVEAPARVLEELAQESGRLADRLAAIAGAGWDRAVVRDGEELSVVWMARNAVHEGGHHLLDVGRVLRHVRGR